MVKDRINIRVGMDLHSFLERKFDGPKYADEIVRTHHKIVRQGSQTFILTIPFLQFLIMPDTIQLNLWRSCFNQKLCYVWTVESVLFWLKSVLEHTRTTQSCINVFILSIILGLHFLKSVREFFKVLSTALSHPWKTGG